MYSLCVLVSLKTCLCVLVWNLNTLCVAQSQILLKSWFNAASDLFLNQIVASSQGLRKLEKQESWTLCLEMLCQE